jgi:hypothetical protein
MAITTKNFSQLVQEWAAVVQSSVTTTRPALILSFTKGAILRALAEGQASVSLWIQGNILQLLTTTRLATCVGIYVDTWIAQFGLSRLPASGATGPLTFGRATPTNPATILVGSTAATSDGSQTFVVYADPTNSAYSATLGGYVIPAAISTLDVPAQFQFPPNTVFGTYVGAVGNVQANSITIIQTGISGVDTVTNNSPFTNGYLAESDSAIQGNTPATSPGRFVNFINSLAKATEPALTYAAQTVQQGIQVQILENTDGLGNTVYGLVTIYVDDGSGAIPAAVQAAANANIQAARAAGVRVAVYPATILQANVTMTLTTGTGYYHPTVAAQVAGALSLYVNGLGLGNTCSYLRLAQVAFDASPGVTDVTSYTLNGVAADLVPAPGQTIKINALVIN